MLSVFLVRLEQSIIAKTRSDLPSVHKIFLSGLFGRSPSAYASKEKEEGNKDGIQPKILIKVQQMHFSAKEKDEFQQICEYSSSSSSDTAAIGTDVSRTMMHIFPHVIGQQFILSLISHPTFPISAVGSLHLRSYFEVLHPNLMSKFLSSASGVTFSMEGKYWGCAPNQKRGTDLVCSLEIFHNESLKLIWKELVVIYSTKQARSHDATAHEILKEYSEYCDFTNLEDSKTASFQQVSSTKDETWRYGFLSGDLNPIHMNEIAARLLGQKSRISHGAMILSKALAHLEQRQGISLPLKFGVSFKGPIPCGSALDIKGTKVQENESNLKDIDLYVVKNTRPNICVRTY